MKYNKFLLGFIVLGLAASLWVNWQRHVVEEQNRQVELVLEYEDATALARQEGVELTVLLGKLKAAGITSLSLSEATLENLQKTGRVAVITGNDLLTLQAAGAVKDSFWQKMLAEGKISTDYVYVSGQTGSLFAEITQDLQQRLGWGRVEILRSGLEPILAVKADWDKLKKWNLGLLTDDLKYIVGQGFLVVPRPSNYSKVTADDVTAVFKRLEVVPAAKISAVIFNGEEVVGYPDQIKVTSQEMKKKNIVLGLVESAVQLQFIKQDGLMDLAALNDYHAARAYVIPKGEQAKMTVEAAVRRWPITDAERNIRLNLLSVFLKASPDKNLIQTNVDYIAQVKAGVSQREFTIGRAGVFQPFFPANWLLGLIVIGATAAGCLYLTLVLPLPEKIVYLMLAAISLILVLPLFLGKGMLVRQAAALVSAVVFPVLAMTWQLDNWDRMSPDKNSVLPTMAMSVLGLVTAVLVSMVGGLYAGSLLGDVRFFLEMEIYRGVKLTFIAPLLLLTIIYLKRYSLIDDSHKSPGVLQQLKQMLDIPVYIKTFIFLALGGIVAWVFVGRSGHTAGVPVPAIEIKMRNFLESAMYARPREKEFMIGHPGFFLATMAVIRRWPRIVHYVLVMVAVIGQGSLAETFAHLRTPVYMSVVRGFDGLAVGILFGVAAVFGLQFLSTLGYYVGREKD